MQVLAAILVDHVLVQEVGRYGRDAPQLQVLVESLLQVLIQIAANTTTTTIQSFTEKPTRITITVAN